MGRTSPLLCRLGCGNLANPHWEQLCSRCFYFNALAPALALGSDFRSVDPQEEVVAEKLARGKDAPACADESKDRFPRPVPTFLSCVVTLQICIFCFTLVANGGPEDMSSGSIGPSYDTLYRCGGLQLQGQKQVWRLFTSIFLHAGVVHLVSNLLVQWVVGGAIELVWGLNWAMLLYLFSGLGGALLSASLSSVGSLTVGASGCVHGFLAACAADSSATQLLAWAVPGSCQRRCRCRRQVLVFVLIVSLISGLFLPQMDTWAHLGGAVAGFAVCAARPAEARLGRLGRLARLVALLVGLGGYAVNNIPQLPDISDFLQQRTGFTLRPISGLLSARDFLNALAFRVFYSTQYIRHHGNPFYTPEPDICHELLGHVPLFANSAFADFSQEIGLASLAATDEDVAKLAAVYWFTVEFGLLREGEDVKAFGAGVLSSFGEMEWACSPSPSQECRDMGSMKDQLNPVLRPLDPWEAAKQDYPITTYQPVMFVANSLEDAESRIAQFCDSLTRPFFPQYDPLTQTIRVTKAIQRAERHSTVELQRQKQMQFFEKTAPVNNNTSTVESCTVADGLVQ